MVDTSIGNIDDLLEYVKDERNDLTLDELAIIRRENPGSFEDMTIKVGGRAFKDAKPRKDLEKIDRAYQGYSIIDVDSGVVADASVFALKYLSRLVNNHVRTGRYRRSISTFVRSVGGVDREIPIGKIAQGDLPSRPVVSIISDVPYANKLETMIHHGEMHGFLYQTSKAVRAEYGKLINVKFDFFAAPRLLTDAKGGTLPRLQISNPGELRGRSSVPGSPSKRRRRR